MSRIAEIAGVLQNIGESLLVVCVGVWVVVFLMLWTLWAEAHRSTSAPKDKVL